MGGAGATAVPTATRQRVRGRRAGARPGRHAVTRRAVTALFRLFRCDGGDRSVAVRAPAAGHLAYTAAP